MAANLARSELLQSARASRPLRVVSLLPSAAEVVCFVGGEQWLVGRGHEDDFPASITDRPAVTSTKHHFTTSAEVDASVTQALASGEGLYSVNAELLRALQPDIIFTQALCSVCAVDCSIVWRIAKEMVPRPVVVTMSPKCLADIITDVRTAGHALGLSSEGERAAAALESRITAAKAHVRRGGWPNGRKPRVMFMEWTDPIFCGGHWTPSLIEMAGGVHPINPANDDSGQAGAGDSFRVPPQIVVDMDPDWMIVSPCGLDISTAKRELRTVAEQEWWKGLRAVKEGRVVVVDGNQMFNRPGPRIVDALEWLVGLLNDKPEFMPSNFPWERWSKNYHGGGNLGNGWKRHHAGQTDTSNGRNDKGESGSSTPGSDGTANIENNATRIMAAAVTSVVGITVNGCQEQSRSEEEREERDEIYENERAGNKGDDHKMVIDQMAKEHQNGRQHQYPSSDASQEAKTKKVKSIKAVKGTKANEGLCLDDWEVQNLAVDIEEIHRLACEKGVTCYKDPYTGYMAFTEVGLKSRGACCGNRCRHCPYGHFGVPPWKGQRLRTIKDPIFLASTESAGKLGLKNRKLTHQFRLLSWRGDMASLLALEALEGHGLRTILPTPIVTLLVFYDAKTGKIILPSFGKKGYVGRLLPISVRAFMDQALYLGRPMLAIPLDSNCESPDASFAALKRGIDAVPGKVLDISFSDRENLEGSVRFLQKENGLCVRDEYCKEEEQHSATAVSISAASFPMEGMSNQNKFDLFQAATKKYQLEVLQVRLSSSESAPEISRVGGKAVSEKEFARLWELGKNVLHGENCFTYVQFQLK